MHIILTPSSGSQKAAVTLSISYPKELQILFNSCKYRYVYKETTEMSEIVFDPWAARYVVESGGARSADYPLRPGSPAEAYHGRGSNDQFRHSKSVTTVKVDIPRTIFYLSPKIYNDDPHASPISVQKHFIGELSYYLSQAENYRQDFLRASLFLQAKRERLLFKFGQSAIPFDDINLFSMAEKNSLNICYCIDNDENKFSLLIVSIIAFPQVHGSALWIYTSLRYVYKKKQGLDILGYGPEQLILGASGSLLLLNILEIFPLGKGYRKLGFYGKILPIRNRNGHRKDLQIFLPL